MDKIAHKTTTNQFKQAYFIAAFTILLIGIAIYVFFRDSGVIRSFRFFQGLSFLKTFNNPPKTDSIWVYMVRYNLPDGLWCLSGLLFIRSIWLANIRWNAIYTGIFVAIALAFEIAQLLELIPGTFDPLDLVFIGIFALLESIIFFLFTKRSIV